MNPQQWQVARALFEAAVDMPRETWIGWLQSQGVDESVRAEVLGMLEADALSGESIGLLSLVPDVVSDYTRTAAEARVGERIGVWETERVLGEGGMGTVYLASRVEGGFTQHAALKLVRDGFAQTEILARLSGERQILASLNHPHIAQLLDGGAAASGEPFLAMEYVDGLNLREHCDAGKLGLHARLRLFLTVCAAVSYAHARLVVHRDLKPANVLVSASGQVKLLDFGIAKLIEQGPSGATTVAQQRMYTPQYAAPEQILGEVTTTAVDVHALGVVLFELLTGQHPFQSPGLTAAGIEQRVLDSAPGRPSKVVCERDQASDLGVTRRDAQAKLRGSTPPQLQRLLRGDLDAIVMKAIRRLPADRYASVQLLSDDIEAYLQRRPVSARRGNLRYTLMRFSQRNAWAMGFAGLAMVALLVGLGSALWQAHEARREAATSAAALGFMQELFASANPEATLGKEPSARQMLEVGSKRIRTALVAQPEARAVLLGAMGEAHLGLGLYAEALPLLDEALQLSSSTASDATTERLLLARAATLFRLSRFQQMLDELGPQRVATDAGREPLRAAGLDYHIGRAAQALGQKALSESHLLAAMTTYEARLGMADRRSQDAAIALVSQYELDRRHEEARQVAQRAVDALGADADGLLRANALSALAMVETNVGDLKKAEALRIDVLAIFREIYGDEHPVTVGAINNLASVVFAQRRYHDALPMYDQVLSAYRQLYAANHTKVALAATNASYAHLLTGDAQGALAMAEEALAIRRTEFGNTHAATIVSIQATATALLMLDRFDEAAALYNEALATKTASSGTGNAPPISIYNNLTRIALAKGRVPADCGYSEQAVTALASSRAEDSLPNLYANALHQACQLRRGEHDDLRPLRLNVEAYHAGATVDDPYLPILDELLLVANAKAKRAD